MINGLKIVMILGAIGFLSASARAVERTSGEDDDVIVVRTAVKTVASGIPDRLSQLGIPGAAIAVVYGGEALLLEGFGTTDPGTGAPVNVERDVFRVGSLSKPVTASGVLRLVASGEVGLDDDQRHRLEKLAIRPHLQNSITLRHLLTHTAGFNERLFGQHVGSPELKLNLSEYLIDHLPPIFINSGELIAYNDHHTALAGWLLEEISGRRFEEVMDQQVFTPVGMTSTTFEQVAIPAEIDRRIVSAWHQSPSGFERYPRDFVQLTPAAGLYTSAPDMARYLLALLNCRNGPLGEAVCSQLVEQFTHHHRLPGRSFGFAHTRQAGMQVFYKDGQASGFNARLMLVPEQGLGIFVVHNRSILGAFGQFDEAARFNRETTGAILDRLWPEQDVAEAYPRMPLTDSVVRSTGYAGSYRTVIAARHTWERLASLFDDAHVIATPTGVRLGSGEYVEIEPGVLQWREGGDRFLIFRSLSGARPHLFIGGSAYEPVPWYTSSRSTPVLVGGVCLWLLLSFFWLRLYRSRLEILQFPILLTNGSLLIFVAGLVAILGWTDPQDFFKGATPALLLLLALPLVAGGGVALQIWRFHEVVAHRWVALLILLNITVAVLSLVWLDYWNLLGYRLG